MLLVILYAVTAVAFWGQVTYARTNRRDVWVPSNPEAFEVKLDFDKVGRHVASIGMGRPWAKVGNFSFLLSTSSPYTAVSAVGCTTCVDQLGQSRIYDLSQSSSASSRNTTQTFNIGNGSMSGPVIRESCILTRSNETKWIYDVQTVIMIESTEGVLGNGSSGFLGLGRSSGNDSYTTAILQSRGWNSLLFGLALNAYNSTADTATAQSAGSFTVLELNQDLYDGQVSWQSIANVTGVPNNVPTDWALKFDSYDISSGSRSTHSSGGVAIIEPYFPELRIPSSEAMEFFSNMPGAKMTNDSSTLSWVFPCNQGFAFTITIDGDAYRMKEEQLVTFDSTRTECTSLVKGWADPSVHDYLFGRPFAASAFIAYRALLDSSGDQIGVARRTGGTTTIIVQHSDVSARTVVASIVGSIVGVSIVAALLFFFIRWRRRARSDTPRSKRKVKKKYVIEPFTVDRRRSSTTPLISARARQDAWIVEQGEIGGEPGSQHDSMTELLGTPIGHTARIPDRKPPLPTGSSPHLVLVRQSQITSSTYSPVPSPRPETGVQTPGQPPLPPPERHDELAPPPYVR